MRSSNWLVCTGYAMAIGYSKLLQAPDYLKTLTKVIHASFTAYKFTKCKKRE